MIGATTGTEPLTVGTPTPCFNLLPCGLCKLTMAVCPKIPVMFAPTWEVTCEAKMEAEECE